MSIKRHFTDSIIAAACIMMLIALTGCSNEKYEDELSYREIGIEAMETGDYESAVAAFNSALSLATGKITDTEIDICYYKAAALYASGKTDDALAVYDSLIEYDKKNADAYYLRGCLLMQNGDYDGARSDFDAAVKYDGSDYELYINIYENFCGYDMTEEGEQYLEKAFNIKGDGADALASRGRIYYLLGQYDNASAELVSAINKGSTEANLTMAAVCAAQGDDETADYYYQAYVDSGTADSAAMNDLAEYEMSRGNYDKALEYIRKGLAMDDVPNRRELLSNKVIACENVADFGDAWEAIQEYISLYPDDMDAQREYVFLKYRQSEESDTEEILEDEPIDTEGMSESDQ